jgi:GT2 family glycosyltransferase
VHQENRGLSAARNKGAQLCNAKYIMFLDDDDIAKPNELETYVKVAEKTDTDALTNIITVFKGDSPPEFDHRYVGIGACLELNFFVNFFGSSNIFIKKSVFEEIGGYKESMVGYEDWDLALRLMFAGKTWELIPESLYWYRNTPKSLMKSMIMDSFESTKILLENYLSKSPPEFYPIFTLAKRMTDEKVRTMLTNIEYS